MRYQEFSALAASYMAQLYNAAGRMTGDTQEAEDLVQETYERAFQAWRQLRDPAHCRAWLYQIMRNLFIDAYRRKRAMPELVVIEGGRGVGEEALSSHVVSLEEEVLRRLSEEEIRQALALLPEEMHTALILCDVEGFTYPEIAEIMGCPVGTVRSRIARARQKLLMKLRAYAEAHGLVQKEKK